MSGLGDFLEVLHGPKERFRSIRATIQHSKNKGVSIENSGPNRTIFGRRKVKETDWPESKLETTETISIWLREPKCARLEYHQKVDDEYSKLTVINENERWERLKDGQVKYEEADDSRRRHSESDEKNSATDAHFSGYLLRRIIENVSLEYLGMTQVAGRDCAKVRAVIRPGCRLWPHWLSHHADEYEFHADAERGILLRILNMVQKEVFLIQEVVEISFDEVLPDDLFNYEPNDGERIEPDTPVTETMTLAAAIKKMPFTVLTPSLVPDPDQFTFETWYNPKRRNNSWPHLALNYRGGKKSMFEWSLWIRLSEAPSKQDDEFEWDDVDSIGGEQTNIQISDPGETRENVMRIVKFQQQGTYVVIYSDIAQSQLLDIVRSFVPATPAR